MPEPQWHVNSVGAMAAGCLSSRRRPDVGLSGIGLEDGLGMIRSLARPFMTHSDHFRAIAWRELFKMTRLEFYREAKNLVVESGPRSTHVLNAVSPAFTCALPLAAHIVNSIKTGE
jgi:hypothetical protein